MNVDVVFLPRDLTPALLADRTAVVFDVLRATTTMTTALARGTPRIFVFERLDDARRAGDASGGKRLLVGEIDAVRPAGFDLGNSPGAFDGGDYAGLDVYMSTTNGTRAIAAARPAALVLTAALLNRTAAAEAAIAAGRDVTLLCSGTQGQLSKEDLLGAGAVIDAMCARAEITLATDAARVVLDLFRAARADLPRALRDTFGGHNVRRAGLDPDVDFTARLDVFDVVGAVDSDALVVRPHVR